MTVDVIRFIVLADAVAVKLELLLASMMTLATFQAGPSSSNSFCVLNL